MSMTDKAEAREDIIRTTVKAEAGMRRLKMDEQQVRDFIEGPDSEQNSVCMADNGHCYCHRQVGCVTIWMEYHTEGNNLCVDSIYHHRVMVQEV